MKFKLKSANRFQFKYPFFSLNVHRIIELKVLFPQPFLTTPIADNNVTESFSFLFARFPLLLVGADNFVPSSFFVAPILSFETFFIFVLRRTHLFVAASLVLLSTFCSLRESVPESEVFHRPRLLSSSGDAGTHFSVCVHAHTSFLR